MDLNQDVYCDSVWGSLSEILARLLVQGYAAARLVGRSAEGDAKEDPGAVFAELLGLFTAAQWLDPNAPSGSDRRGAPTLVIPNPYGATTELPRRIRLAELSLPAAILRAFTILRVRFQPGVSTPNPQVRIEAPKVDPGALDGLYLIGDAFTERYPVKATLSADAAYVRLDLVGEPQPVGSGLRWPRGDYIRSRDAALIFHPLWEAVLGMRRPLAVPRRGPQGAEVRVRLPSAADLSAISFCWIEDLQQLKGNPPEIPLSGTGYCGENHTFMPSQSGTLLTVGQEGAGQFVPLQVTDSRTSHLIESESDGSVHVWFEGLGGAREIGANSYYYRFGRRGLLVDCGFDVIREGWLGLPSLERITRLDAAILTHAHLDHVGSLPVLLASFSDIPIYCTRATYELLYPTLQDSAKVAKLRRENTGEVSAITLGLVERIGRKSFRFVNFGDTVEVPEIPGLSLTFHDAGHMIGSLYVEMRFQGMTIAHTGDINLLELASQKGLSLEGKTADHVVMEGTYGLSTGLGPAQRQEELQKFEAAVAERIDAGGSILIPAFALGRAQEFVALLSGWNRRTGRSIPILTVGMANRINELIRNQLTDFMPTFTPEAFTHVASLDMGRTRRESEEDRRRNAAESLKRVVDREPCLIIASHGMMIEGTSSYLLGRAILTGSDPRLAIFLCGYMDPRSPGFRLLHHGGDEIIDFGVNDRVRRTIPPERIAGYHVSSHASFEELMQVADVVPAQTLVLVHGDGSSLDNLKRHIEQRYAQAGRKIPVHAPSFGTKVVLGQVDVPEGWTDEASEYVPMEEIAPGRRGNLRKGFEVRGLTIDDGRTNWALIPVDRKVVRLGLETEAISPNRVRRFALPANRYHAGAVLYDRDRAMGDWRQFEWQDVGRWHFTMTVDDADGQPIDSTIQILVGNELRLVQNEIDATNPVLELQAGGVLAPSHVSLSAGSDGCEIPIRDFSWAPEERLIRVRLQPAAGIGALHSVQPAVRWSNGFPQYGPSLGDITLEPTVQFQPAPVRVGIPAWLSMTSSPPALAGRIGTSSVKIEGESLNYTANSPGPADLWLGYKGLSGETEWRFAGSINVQPAAQVSVPGTVERGREFIMRVAGVAEDVAGRRLSLSIGGVHHEWIADDKPCTFAHTVQDESEELAVEIRNEEEGWVLWQTSIAVIAGLTLDERHSIPVTTADASLIAELAWLGVYPGDKERIERAIADLGFALRGWNENVLRVVGQAKTLGRRVVRISDYSPPVTLWTLPSLNVQISPPGPCEPGSTVRLSVGGEPLLDEDPAVLRWEVDRISPLMDSLSVRFEASHVQLLHPGRYSVAVVACGRRLAESIIDVIAPRHAALPTQGASLQFEAASAEEAVATMAKMPVGQPTAILIDQDGRHRVASGSEEDVEAAGWRWIRERLQGEDPLLVCWPGQPLPHLAGRWIAKLRTEAPEVSCAHLSYPAPRGEVAATAAEARRMREYRVLCALPCHSTIDRGDAYCCPKCGSQQVLRTNAESVWLACTSCGAEDRLVILTLRDLRDRTARVLFGEHRIVTYLTAGSGLRYGGVFARTVRCKSCQRPQPAYQRPSAWESSYLHRLEQAVAADWDEADPVRSVRRAAWRAARRSANPASDLPARMEADIRSLLDAGVFQAGRPTERIERLERGTSVCCDAELGTWRRPLSRIYIGIESLYDSSSGTFYRPGLPARDEGLRSLLRAGA